MPSEARIMSGMNPSGFKIQFPIMKPETVKVGMLSKLHFESGIGAVKKKTQDCHVEMHDSASGGGAVDVFYARGRNMSVVCQPAIT